MSWARTTYIEDMPKLSLVLLIAFAAACGDNYVAELSPDAAVDAAPIVVDAAPQQQRGCSMGNLPNAVTIVLGDNDPVPSSLLNELQEIAVAGNYKPQTLNIGGEAFCIDLGAPTRVGSLWTFQVRGINGNPFTVPNDASHNRLAYAIPLPVGTTIRSIKWSAHVHNDTLRIFVGKRSIGDGGVTFTTAPAGGPAPGQTYFAGPGGDFFSGGSSWFLHELSPDFINPQQILIEAGFIYTAYAETWGTTGTPAQFDGLQIIHDRQP